MKITFLGTGKGGYPTLTRNCCAIMLECGDGIYLIDCGSPVLDQMTRLEKDFNKLRAVFLTHMHGDHTFGLPALCSVCSWHYRDSDFDVFFAERQGADTLKAYILASDKVFHEDRIRLKTIAGGVIYSDENVTVTAIPTAHCLPYPSYAFIFEGEGKRIVFSGDLRRPGAPDFPKTVLTEHSDAFVCELCHFTADHIFPILASCPTDRVFFNHIGGADVNVTIAQIRDFSESAPMRIYAPDDLDSYEI